MEAARARRWESGRHAEGGGGQEVRSLMQVAMGLGMLRRRQVTPWLENDHVWRNYGRKGREGRGMSGYPPQLDIG